MWTVRHTLQWPHQSERRGWLATAKVGKSPGGIAQHTDFGVLLELLQQRWQGIEVQNEVTALGRVASNVTQRPNSLQNPKTSDWLFGRTNYIQPITHLLADIVRRARQQLHKDGHCARIDDDLGVV